MYSYVSPLQIMDLHYQVWVLDLGSWSYDKFGASFWANSSQLLLCITKNEHMLNKFLKYAPGMNIGPRFRISAKPLKHVVSDV